MKAIVMMTEGTTALSLEIAISMDCMCMLCTVQHMYMYSVRAVLFMCIGMVVVFVSFSSTFFFIYTILIYIHHMI